MSTYNVHNHRQPRCSPSRRRSPPRAATHPLYTSPSSASSSFTLPPSPHSDDGDDDDDDDRRHGSSPAPYGIARKVAASLQLFKESQSQTHPPASPRSSTLPAIPDPDDPGPLPDVEEVGEAQFVKRAAWPDRENAALRRQKSSTALERVRPRDDGRSAREQRDADTSRQQHSFRDDLFKELLDWRNDVRLPRDVDAAAPFDPPPVPPTPPPGPSLRVLRTRATTSVGSSPPTSVRLLGLSSPASVTQAPIKPAPQPPPSSLPAVPMDRPAPTASPHTSLERRRALTPFSPWTTDDETWDEDSASATTFSTATTRDSLSRTRGGALLAPRAAREESPAFLPRDWGRLRDEDVHTRAAQTPHAHRERPAASFHAPLADADTARDALPPTSASSPSANTEGPSSYSYFSPTGNDLDFQMLSGRLPHIPLRPFRNQVGGHSAIYKFTKRAVCKARFLFPTLSQWWLM